MSNSTYHWVTTTDTLGDKHEEVVQADTKQLALQYVLERATKWGGFFFTDECDIAYKVAKVSVK